MTAPTLAMILYPPPGSPLWLQGAAIALAAAHMCGGVIGVLSGFAALLLPKGRPAHRLAGRVFLVAMLSMSAVAACVAPFMSTQQWSNTIAGVFTFYLVATGWAAAHRAPGRLSRPEAVAIVVPLGIAALNFVAIALGKAGQADGVPAPAPYVMGGLATLAAASDVSALWRGGLAGGQRLARHLWRLCAGLLIATGSGLSQPRIVPAALQDSPFLFAPILVILAVMTFWLVRLAMTDRRRGARAPRAAAPVAAG